MIGSRVQSRSNARAFGRRQPFVHAQAIPAAPIIFSDDLKLFLTAFVGGFLFVSILLA